MSSGKSIILVNRAIKKLEKAINEFRTKALARAKLLRGASQEERKAALRPLFLKMQKASKMIERITPVWFNESLSS